MKILFNPQLNINSYNKRLQPAKNYNIQPLKQDTISFSGRIPKDLMSLSEHRIIAECQKALKNNIIIGEGKEAIVYKMESYPEYCIRREKKTGGYSYKFKLNKKLNNYDKVNHVVAKLDAGTQIMKYIPGIPLKIMQHDTKAGIQVKNTVKELVANNFTEHPFKKVISQVEAAKSKGIDFDRRGENLHVDPLSQEMVCFDFSPRYHDIEYNPISYIYSALDVDKTEHGPKIFGKLCKAYAQRLLEVPTDKLNLEYLDTNFYHRGFLNDPFDNFPNKPRLNVVSERLQLLINAKKDNSNPKEYLEYLVKEFKEYIDENIMTLEKEPYLRSFDFYE